MPGLAGYREKARGGGGGGLHLDELACVLERSCPAERVWDGPESTRIEHNK